MSPSFGELVVHQFTTELSALEKELSGLALARRATGPNHPRTQAIDARVERLSARFEQSREMVELLLSGDSDPDSDAKRLKDLVDRIGRLVSEILRLDDPHGGMDSISELVLEHRAKSAALGKVVQVTPKGQDPILDLPGVPTSVGSDPALAIAILLDVIRMLILGKKKD